MEHEDYFRRSSKCSLELLGLNPEQITQLNLIEKETALHILKTFYLMQTESAQQIEREIDYSEVEEAICYNARKNGFPSQSA